MKNLKRNEAITLVALVVTIIILLILAGITISQLTNSGLFNNTQIAKQEYENAQAKEDDILKQYENAISTGEIASTRDTTLIMDDQEREIGTFWGEKLYRKTIKGTTPATNNDDLIDLSYLNIDKCINLYGTVNTSAGFIPFGFSQDGEYVMVYYNNDKKVKYRSKDASYIKTPYYLTIEYTKTSNN